MCSLKIPPQVIKQIDIYRKHCVWSKGDINIKRSCLVAWETACKPKDQGGLRILDIESHNNALLMKFLDKFYNNAELPWVSLTWNKFYANAQTPQARSPVDFFWRKHYGKQGLCRVFPTLPSAKCRALGKDILCRVPHSAKPNTRHIHLCRVPGTRQRIALGKASLCRVSGSRQS